MKVLLELRHNKLLFVFARKFLNFIAMLFDFSSREVRTSLKGGDIF